MQISAITIENFKSIKDPVRIELKPITLLFGANSVGKSTVIQALHFAAEIFRSGELDIDKTETGGEHVRLHGFSNLIHNHDLSKTVRLRFELKATDNYYSYPMDHFMENDDSVIDCQLSGYPEEIMRIKEYYKEKFTNGESPWLEFGIKQDSLSEKPYMSYSMIGFGKTQLITVGEDEANITQIELHDISDKIFTKGNIEIIETYFNQEVTEDQKLFFVFTGTLPQVTFGWDPPFIYSDDGKIVEQDIPPLNQKFERLLNTLWTAHYETIEKDLKQFRYIGPLRELTDSATVFSTENEPHRWANGLAAWDLIHLESRYSEIHLKQINEWLTKEFKTEYRLVRWQYKELDVNGPIYRELINTDSVNDHSLLVGALNKIPVKTRLFFQSEKSDIKLQSRDIGVGISQVFPIISLILDRNWDEDDIIAIEQPELHIHPAMQVVLGDLFIEGIIEDDVLNRRRFLLETHSEHLLLRLLRRLREPKIYVLDGHEFKPDNLGIYFLELDTNGTKATRIRVNEEGEFKDPWPRGFFNERAEELF